LNAASSPFDGDCRTVGVTVYPGFNTADDAAAGAKRDHRGLGAARPVAHCDHLGFVTRIDDDIGGIVILPGKAARVV
jgi:hypothetical protein